MGEMDEIWELYADDGTQALDTIEEVLDSLREGADDASERIGALFRAVHTFKGNSRVLGLSTVEGCAHLAEDLIGMVRDDGVPMTEEIVELLMLVGDTLRGMLEETAATRADLDPAPYDDLKNQLRRMIAKYSGQEEEPEVQEPVAEEPEPEIEDAEEIEPEQQDETAEDSSDEDAEMPEEDTGEELAAAPAAPAAPKAMSAADMMMAELLAQDDGDKSWAGDDDLEFDDLMSGGEDYGAAAEEEEAEATPEPEPEPEIEEPVAAAPEPAPAAKPAKAKPEPEPEPEVIQSSGVVIDDPVYRQIFLDMVEKTISDLQKHSDAGDVDTAYKVSNNLGYAAEQLKLGDWVAATQTFEATKGGDGGAEALTEAIAALSALKTRDFGGGEEEAEEAAPEHAAASSSPVDNHSIGAMIVELSGKVAELSHLGLSLGSDNPPDPKKIKALSDEIAEKIAPFGYVRIEEAALLIPRAKSAKAFKSAELSLYEELAAVEQVLPHDAIPADAVRPTTALQLWSADTIYDTLGALRVGLEHSSRDAGKNWFPEFETLMRRAFHASAHYRIETASQLTMALVDLFARARMDDVAPDAILIQMARGFVETMDLVFDALDQGDQPDIERIERLFEEASNATFMTSGLVTARSIEQRLGLPKEFHRVMSPDSVKAAQSAIEEGRHFFVIRADLNKDEKLAEKFLQWVTAGHAKMITNVTIFQDDETLFDFLIAATLPEHLVVEQLANLDPAGKNLSMTMALEVKSADGTPEEVAAPADDMDLHVDFGTGMLGSENLRVIEAIGEISAGQAMVDHSLTELVEFDMMHDLSGRLRNAGIEDIDARVRAVMREAFEAHLNKLRQIKEAGAQLNSKMAQLQEESVEMRSRPANVLLRPLEAFVVTQARKAGRELRFSTTGGEVPLDQMVIEELRTMMKTVLLSRLNSEKPPRKVHLSVDREEDLVRVEINDDGGPIAKEPELEEIRASLARRRGAFRTASVPNAGQRIQISLPLHMVVLEGMVVRVGGVRYVVPIEAIQRIHQGHDIIPVKAAGNHKMLRIGDGELVPIKSLPRDRDADQNDRPHLFVIARNTNVQLAIPVDELLGPQLVLLRPLRGALAGVRGMTGVAILSGGEVGMVVSVSRIADMRNSA